MIAVVACAAIIAGTEWACKVYRRRAAVPYTAPPAAPPSHVRRLPR